MNYGTQFMGRDKTEEPTVCGLSTWPVITQSEIPNPNVYVNKSRQALSKADVDEFHSKVGKTFPILSDGCVRTGVVARNPRANVGMIYGLPAA